MLKKDGFGLKIINHLLKIVFLKIYFYFLIICMCFCMLVYHMCVGAHGSQKRVHDPLELQLLVVMI